MLILHMGRTMSGIRCKIPRPVEAGPCGYPHNQKAGDTPKQGGQPSQQSEDAPPLGDALE
jgi:hypothetical protein